MHATSGSNAIHRSLKRMLGNGPLTGLPARPADQDLIAELAALRFETGRLYRESEVNELLKGWLATFCAPYGIDHVTFRRQLVDARLLQRDTAGATYRVNLAKLKQVTVETTTQPGEVLFQLRHEREARKREHAVSPETMR